jgi:predicted SAM-dependent methyltransferase
MPDGYSDIIANNLEKRRKSIRLAEEMRRRDRSSLRYWAKWALEPAYALATRLRARRNARKAKPRIAAYLAGDGFKGLHVGCGPFLLPGWLNTDVAPRRAPWRGPSADERRIDFALDVTQPLPFTSACLDAIFAEEVIEHVEVPDAYAFFREAHRVLKASGVLRMTTPDVLGVCKVYAGAAGDVAVTDFEPFWISSAWSPENWVNGAFRFYGHKHLWSFDEMAGALKDAGFARVERVFLHETTSGRPELEGLERHGVDNPEVRRITRATRLIVEAYR